MTKRVALLLVGLLLAPAAARAQQAKRPEFVGLQVDLPAATASGNGPPSRSRFRGGATS